MDQRFPAIKVRRTAGMQALACAPAVPVRAVPGEQVEAARHAGGDA